jgi:hypothetical protein
MDVNTTSKVIVAAGLTAAVICAVLFVLPGQSIGLRVIWGIAVVVWVSIAGAAFKGRFHAAGERKR